MGVYWAKPTLEDIASQRAMIERGEEKRRAAKQAEERGRLRDTFAAAALTGFIRGMPSDCIFHLDLMAKQSYEVADAMLREREQTNHDVAPETIAAEPESSVPPGSVAAPANTHKPAAWARFFPNGGVQSVYLDRHPVDAEPLYRHPPCQDLLQKNFTLTDAEREAIEWCIEMATIHATDCDDELATLRNLLARLA